MNMTRNHRLELGSSLLVAAGIVASTWIASLAVAAGWLVLVGPLLLAITLASAVMLDARTAGRPPDAYAAALLLGVSFVLADLILVLRGGDRVVQFVPIMGAAGWIALLPRSGNRRASCRRA